MGMEIRLGVLQEKGVADKVVRVAYGYGEQAHADSVLLGQLFGPDWDSDGAQMSRLRLVCWCTVSKYGSGRLYDGGQIAFHVNPKRTVQDRTVFVPTDQGVFFQSEDTEDME